MWLNNTHVYCNYLIFDRVTALRSVFWNRALINCFISFAGNSSANGPFPSAHRSDIPIKLASNTILSSNNFCHFATRLLSSALASDDLSLALIRKSSGSLSISVPKRTFSILASSADISSNVVMALMTSTRTVLSRHPEKVMRAISNETHLIYFYLVLTLGQYRCFSLIRIKQTWQQYLQTTTY